jgi:hypothetical protein
VDLGKLEPQWLSPPGRYGVGFSFRCPVCISLPHRVHVFLNNPVDGFAQIEHDGDVFLHTLVLVETGIQGAIPRLDQLTLLEPIALPCWEGVLLEGDLLEH